MRSKKARYASKGLPKVPGKPKGTDTVPAWLTPGEAVLTPGAAQALGRQNIANLNQAYPPQSYANGTEAVGMVNGRPDYGYGNRYQSNEPKGQGYFGPVDNGRGQVSTEISANMGRGEVPLMVPTLNAQELHGLVNHEPSAPKAFESALPIPDSVYQKANDHALMRQLEGRSPFAGPQDARAPLPRGYAEGTNYVDSDLNQSLNRFMTQSESDPYQGQWVHTAPDEHGNTAHFDQGSGTLLFRSGEAQQLTDPFRSLSAAHGKTLSDYANAVKQNSIASEGAQVASEGAQVGMDVANKALSSADQLGQRSKQRNTMARQSLQQPTFLMSALQASTQGLNQPSLGNSALSSKSGTMSEQYFSRGKAKVEPYNYLQTGGTPLANDLAILGSAPTLLQPASSPFDIGRNPAYFSTYVQPAQPMQERVQGVLSPPPALMPTGSELQYGLNQYGRNQDPRINQAINSSGAVFPDLSGNVKDGFQPPARATSPANPVAANPTAASPMRLGTAADLGVNVTNGPRTVAQPTLQPIPANLQGVPATPAPIPANLQGVPTTPAPTTAQFGAPLPASTPIANNTVPPAENVFQKAQAPKIPENAFRPYEMPLAQTEAYGPTGQNNTETYPNIAQFSIPGPPKGSVAAMSRPANSAPAILPMGEGQPLPAQGNGPELNAQGEQVFRDEYGKPMPMLFKGSAAGVFQGNPNGGYANPLAHAAGTLTSLNSDITPDMRQGAGNLLEHYSSSAWKQSEANHRNAQAGFENTRMGVMRDPNLTNDQKALVLHGTKPPEVPVPKVETDTMGNMRRVYPDGYVEMLENGQGASDRDPLYRSYVEEYKRRFPNTAPPSYGYFLWDKQRAEQNRQQTGGRP